MRGKRIWFNRHGRTAAKFVDNASCPLTADCKSIACRAADNLLDQGEVCSENRVAQLASLAGISAQMGYKRRPGRYCGKPAVVADNTLDRQFEVDAPDRVWVTDITYIKTQEGSSYLAVVIDLFSRRVVGWSMQSRMTTDLALQALLSAV
jgi:putative transposase